MTRRRGLAYGLALSLLGSGMLLAQTPSTIVYGANWFQLNASPEHADATRVSGYRLRFYDWAATNITLASPSLLELDLGKPTPDASGRFTVCGPRVTASASTVCSVRASDADWARVLALPGNLKIALVTVGPPGSVLSPVWTSKAANYTAPAVGTVQDLQARPVS